MNNAGSRVLKQSASLNWKVKVKGKAEMKKVRSSLNLDLNLSLPHSFRLSRAACCGEPYWLELSDELTKALR